MSISPLSAPGGESLLEDPRLGPTHDTPLEPESHTSSSERTMLENLNSANDPELQALVGAADEHDSSAGSFLVGTSPGSPRSDAAQRKQPFLRAADGTHARHPAELHDSAACGNGASTLITVVDTAPRRDSDDSSAHRQWNCGGINTMSLAPAPPARANPADPARAERGHSFLSPEELARRFPNLYAPKKPEVAPDAQPAAPTRPPRLAEPHAETGAEPNKHGAMMHGSPSLHTTSSNSYPLQFHTGLSKLSESRDDHPSIRLDKVHRRVGGEAVSSDSRHEQHTRPRPVNIHPPRKTESSNPTHGSSGDQQVSTTSSGGSNMSPSFLSPPVKLDEVFSYSPINQTGNKGIVQGSEYQQGGFGATGRPYPPRNPAAANFADVPTSVGAAQEHFGQESAVPSAWGQGNFPTASQPMRHPFLGDMSSSPTTPPSVPLAPSVMGDAQYRQCMALCAQMFFSLQQQQNTHNPAAAAMLGEFSTAVVGPETFGMDPGAASMWCQANSGATAFARNPYLGGMMAPTMPGNGNACMNDPQLLNCMSLCAQMFLTLQAQQQQQQQQVQMSTMAAMMDESSMNPARPGTLSPLFQAAGFLPTDQRNPTYARTDLSGVFGAFPSADGFGVNGSRHAFSSAAAAAAAAALSNISSQGPTSPEGQSDPPATRPNNFRGDRQAADKSIRERETLSHSKSSNRAPRQGNYSQQQQNGRSAKDDTKGSRGKTQSTSQSKQKANNKPNPRKTDQSQPQTPHKKLYFSTDPFSVYGHNKSLVESSAN